MANGNGGVPHVLATGSNDLVTRHDATAPAATWASVHLTGIDGVVHAVLSVTSMTRAAPPRVLVAPSTPMALALAGAVNSAMTMSAYDTNAIRTTNGAIRVARRGRRTPEATFGVGWMTDWLNTGSGIGPSSPDLENSAVNSCELTR